MTVKKTHWDLLSSLLSLSILFSITSPELQKVTECPEFSATMIEVIDQTVDEPGFVNPDPDLTFLKEIMGFRDSEITSSFNDAIVFFNQTYGLDFSLSRLNERNELIYENATFRPVRFREEIKFKVLFNNWITTGYTRTRCILMHNGGFHVTFTGDMTLRGSYGGESGISDGVAESSIVYGYLRVDVCQQSPIIIQYQSASPFRTEPVDGIRILNLDVYNNVLGYGKGTGVFMVRPDPDNPEKFRVFSRALYIF